ncbi:hypothetical protein FALBO_12470 [Fusarium albosuccineum]|uniref:Xylanolytic transcriptional activator regulatory domain-containing protein n=1 Tax=Fusarium albosuccineum TaxID=1237068 RepID=A0A8H4P336_9HYPO|nr:hypothetical protein FALBO_12470 [Fusarium albosuccineum]
MFHSFQGQTPLEPAAANAGRLLFPHHSLEELIEKNRDELIQLVSLNQGDNVPVETQTGQSLTVTSPSVSDHDKAPDFSDEIDSGQSGEGRHWDEPAQDLSAISPSDDINAIGLAADKHHHSYLGITSISTVLRAIFRLHPVARDYVARQLKQWSEVQDGLDSSFVPNQAPDIPLACDSIREQRYVGFYFEHIHAITPLLGEDSFRVTFAAGTRQTRSWLALRNMVLTLGSIASGSNTVHTQYYRQARQFLDLDSLGSGNLETLQALCLLGGYYLHYRNSPNMAYAILGAAQRLAIALGLHRESPDCAQQKDAEASQRNAIQIETRRRTWWSLYCLDTWASMTLGRPTCGRWDTSTMNTLLPTELYHDDYFAVSLRASCHFCHTCNRLQHRVAQSTRINTQEAQALDDELQDWHKSLPSVLRETSYTPPRITVAYEFLHNRYHNARLILSRCFLVYMAHENTRSQSTAQNEVQMVDKCRNIAAEAINFIALHWSPNHIRVWSSAWYLFQACTVPLLSIAVETSINPDGVESDTVMACRANLNRALGTLADMKPWMRTSDRTPDIVSILFQALSEKADGVVDIPSVTEEGSHLIGWADEPLAEIDWNVLPLDENLMQTLL